MPRLSAEQRHRVRLTLNGRAVEGEAEPRMLLTDFLRHELGATGTHVGCEHGVCGACTVEIDGAPARACLTLAVQADGATIRTVEGLAPRARPALGAAGGVPPPPRAAMRLLHAGHPDVARHLSARRPSPTETELREFLSGHLCRCTGYVPIVAAALEPRKGCGGRAQCLISAQASSPASRAIRTRWRSSTATCGSPMPQWYRRISALVAGFDALELKPGDHLVTVLQNRWEAATMHWACQFAGIIITPLNWRATADELDYCLDECRGQGAGLRGGVGRGGGGLEGGAAPCRGSSVGVPRRHAVRDRWWRSGAGDVAPRADAEAWSVMLYTSGTTAKPKGVPRRQRAERAAALAHVAQNLYRPASARSA